MLELSQHISTSFVLLPQVGTLLFISAQKELAKIKRPLSKIIKKCIIHCSDKNVLVCMGRRDHFLFHLLHMVCARLPRGFFVACYTFFMLYVLREKRPYYLLN